MGTLASVIHGKEVMTRRARISVLLTVLMYFVVAMQIAYSEPIVGKPDCGPKCLLAVMEHYGLAATLEEMLQLSAMDPDLGVTLQDLALAAQRKGFRAFGRKMNAGELKALDAPAILYVPAEKHFLVCWGYTGKGYDVWDPYGARLVVNEETLAMRWQGVVLVIYPCLPNSESTPKLLFDSYIHDFGVMGTHETANAVFSLHNAGEVPLHINDVKTTCGCLVVAKKPDLVAPGEKAEIRVQFLSTDHEGIERPQLIIASDDKDEPSLTLRMRANIVTQYEVRPSVLSFGTVPLGTGAIGRVLVRCKSGTQITSATTDIPGVTTEYFNDGIPVGQFRSQVVVALGSNVMLGPIHGFLSIASDNPAKPMIEVPITGRVESVFRATPSVVFFGQVDSGTLPKRTVEFSSSDGSDVKILSVEPADERLTACLEQQGNDTSSHTIICEVSAKASAGLLVSWVDVHLADEREPVRRIPVYALIR